MVDNSVPESPEGKGWILSKSFYKGKTLCPCGNYFEGDPFFISPLCIYCGTHVSCAKYVAVLVYRWTRKVRWLPFLGNFSPYHTEYEFTESSSYTEVVICKEEKK